MVNEVNDILTNEIDGIYSSRVPYSHRKNYGQFFTPFIISDFMAFWILNSKKDLKILDPGIGTAVFERSIFKKYSDQDIAIDAYEIDQKLLSIAKEIKERITPIKLNLFGEDFLKSGWDKKYDAIICNPPYYKHHFINDKENLFNTFDKNISFGLSLNTNIYCLFIVKALNQLAYNGRMAFITPSEFLNSNYGEKVKDYILKSGFLRYIIIFDFKMNIFDNATTTACISLYANDSNNHKEIKIIDITEEKQIAPLYDLVSQWNSINASNIFVYNPTDLDPKLKWKNYINPKDESTFLVPFTRYARVMRGIATGDNGFFTLSEEEVDKLKVNKKYILPCVTKAPDARNNIFTQDLFETLRKQGKKVYLLYLNKKDLDEPVKTYLKYGENKGVDKKYLTSHRTPWYNSEDKPPAPIWLTVFNRNSMRFIRNEANAYNLTCFHGVYLTNLGQQFKDALMAYLVSDLAQEIFKREKREYGNGLGKFEPNDINKSKIIDFSKLTETELTKVEFLYHRFRDCVISKKVDLAEKYRKEINEEFSKILEKHATEKYNPELQLQFV